ncbi:hypothetical protein MUO79_10010 [Candidatus Bathyarchaeota archaeon]|nr:hypothetical protein [Candidatus Bathyarchaeota archaeon]
MSGGYDIKQVKADSLRSIPEDRKEHMWQEYFMRLDALIYDDDGGDRKQFYYAIQDEAMRTLCGKDEPDKVIYGKFTAEDLITQFDKNETYTTMAVAAKLGINYHEAYKHVIPWLIGHGFNVKSGAKHLE